MTGLTTVATSPPGITAICSDCYDPIDAGDGWLCVDLLAATDRVAQHRIDPVVPGWPDALLAPPLRVPWQAWHRWCLPPQTRPRYRIAVENVATWPGLVAVTVRLSEKNWLAHTQWMGELAALVGRGDGLLRAGEP